MMRRINGEAVGLEAGRKHGVDVFAACSLMNLEATRCVASRFN